MERRGIFFPSREIIGGARPVERTDEAWRQDIGLLEAMFRSMREAIEKLKPTDPYKFPNGSKVDNRAIIARALNHLSGLTQQ